DGWRSDIEALYDGRPSGRAAFLEQPVQAFGLGQADFMAVIDGTAMDVVEDIRAPDLVTLDLYCDRVACAVGRLSTRVFGMEEKPGVELARELGRALQLTNILRDLDEDAEMGRLYLPGELLRQAGITTTDPNAAIGDPRVDGACRALAQRALEHFAAADRLMRSKPRGRCRSYYDSQLEMTIGNGNHLVLTGNPAVQRFLGAIGAQDRLTGPSIAAFPYFDVATGRTWTLRPNDGVIPWWILGSNRRVPGTGLGEYLALASLMRRHPGRRIDEVVRCKGALWERFLRPLLVSVLNTPPEEGSADLA